jgi:glutamate--cysteine ligase
VLSALVDDPVASAAAEEACSGLGDWGAAARYGLAAAGLQDAAVACFDAAVDALCRGDEHADLVARVLSFRDRYVRLGRSPADDPLEVR